MKNLIVCGDCHHARKFISKVHDRETVVQDRITFHHFKADSVPATSKDHCSPGGATEVEWASRIRRSRKPPRKGRDDQQ
ncbi:hypothetical protein B296_00032632 [Ensete ventricosum]|uniref:DYW domain-containing protein n=1 Tax=Ensete ventricosum TaxID=4639 RepID=A0A427ABP5_ENSVE|nr:hypothetical protein B296_00032632 [Ensete ventricosum]